MTIHFRSWDRSDSLTVICMTATLRVCVLCSPFPRYTCTSLCMTATLRVRVLCSPFPRYTEKPCDNGQESSRVDEELRLLHNHRRARCLDVQCNAHFRLCTVGLRRTKRHCSSQFREYVATNYRPKTSLEFSGELPVYSRYTYISSAAYKPVNARRQRMDCLVKIKSSLRLNEATYSLNWLCTVHSLKCDMWGRDNEPFCDCVGGEVLRRAWAIITRFFRISRKRRA